MFCKGVNLRYVVLILSTKQHQVTGLTTLEAREAGKQIVDAEFWPVSETRHILLFPSTIFFLFSFFFFFLSFFFPLLFLEVVNSTALGSFQSSLECFGWAGALFLNFEKPFFLHQWNKISWNYGRALRWKCLWGMLLKRVLFFHVIAWL